MNQSQRKRWKDRLRPLWVKVVRKWVGSWLKLALLTRRRCLRPMSGNPLGQYKRSDTLFVLGSGASINELTPEQWACIAGADSVGFNNWHLHPFLPTLYVNEPGKDLAALKDEFANLLRRGYDRAAVPVLLKDVERYRRHELDQVLDALPATVLPNVSLSWDWEIHEQQLARFSRLLVWLGRMGVLGGRIFPVLRKRASVFFLIMLALRAGYRRIVLCGIDLNNTDYFYEASRGQLEADGYWLPPAKAALAAHKTDDPQYGALTISAAVLALNDLILLPRGIELSVASTSSRLYPGLPCFFAP